MASDRVLVVDDDVMIRTLVSAVLTEEGFDVVAAESGAEALEYLSRDTPARVISDVWLSNLVAWLTRRSSATDVARRLELTVELLLGDGSHRPASRPVQEG